LSGNDKGPSSAAAFFGVEASDGRLEIEASESQKDYEFTSEWPPPVQRRRKRRDPNLLYLTVRPVWIFHKSDADPWPSLLHGHHNQRPLKLDAITGEIFNIHSRKCVQKLKSKELARIQAQLFSSKDFAQRAEALIGHQLRAE
jgi:hypothetical protein